MRTEARAEIFVRGLVQGVGFRPFCHRLASKLGLAGTVRNLGDAGVHLILEGEKGKIEEFLETMFHDHPPLAKILEVEVRLSKARGEFKEFIVSKSEPSSFGKISLVPPDITICEKCLSEIENPSDRRYRYPFTTCVDCGPRFTIIESLPYDREGTSMKDFPLCSDCSLEYHNPEDRRYRAEPTCCPKCGPKVFLLNSDGRPISAGDPLLETAKLLDEGFIVAIKGIGGTHVAAKTTDDDVLIRLRKNFCRPQQPFAVMSLNLERIRTFAEVDQKAESLLASVQRPIVLLKKKRDFPLSDLVSPGLDTIGVMLPYSGIHHLILSEGKDPAYIMTSANLPGLPMVIDNSEALSALRGLVDYFLLHDRRIVNRCDDSVVRFTADGYVFIRRSRGYAPLPLEMKFRFGKGIAALGGDLCVTGAVTKDGKCFLTQHIGDVSKFETLLYLRAAVHRLIDLLKIEKIDVVVCDMHPAYSTTGEAKRLADETGAEIVQVQHHHAHLAGLAAEYGLDELLGIAADGAGYGLDGTIWGGEVLLIQKERFEKIGGLKACSMPGGDLATIYPARMVAGILWDALSKEELREILVEFCLQGFPRGEKEIEVLLAQLNRKVNVPLTSSLGRLLDASSCLLGICSARTYEGEPAMKLEALASAGDPSRFRPEIERSGNFVDQASLLLQVVEALRAGVKKSDIAAGVQASVARALAEIAVEKAEELGIKTVGVSGGVFYNDAIARTVKEVVERRGLRFLISRQIPLGDGGISAGQAVVASFLTS
ncbi:MAG: carbamoyltransferase HypF [Candidatus Hadarchaeales archaeon]